MNRIYRLSDRESYIKLLMAKVQDSLLVHDLPNASLLVLAMNNNIDLDGAEFACADKARIRSDLESEWVYAIPRFFDELKKVKR